MKCASEAKDGEGWNVPCWESRKSMTLTQGDFWADGQLLRSLNLWTDTESHNSLEVSPRMAALSSPQLPFLLLTGAFQ